MKLNRIAGIFLILLGLLYLTLQILFQMNMIDFHAYDLWPVTTIALGLLFESIYMLTKRNPGFVIPGGILVTIGTLHMFEVITNWNFAAYTWPIYILAPAVGLFQFHLITKRRGALVAAYILLLVALFNATLAFAPLLFGTISFEIILSSFIILIGIFILLTSFRPSRN